MTVYHRTVSTFTQEWQWEQVSDPFDELILSWNGVRPWKGFWRFSIRLFQEQWSPWIEYAEWGVERQKTFRTVIEGSPAKGDQDIVRTVSGLASAFQVKVTAVDGADLSSLNNVTAACSQVKGSLRPTDVQSLTTVQLPWMPRKSQWALSHPRRKDLCSPTSTSAAIHYLCGHEICPALFAERVRDQEFDIYGNWILNTAAASQWLGGTHTIYVARLPSFHEAHALLQQQLPVVVSVQGEIAGAPQAYPSGHLLLLTGYDRASERVLCMDPACPADAATETSYELTSFLAAWGRRRHLAYVFWKKNE